jgi:hypothetical protein
VLFTLACIAVAFVPSMMLASDFMGVTTPLITLILGYFFGKRT